ncbi:MAG: F0F1 ATP synthase subunit delta [Patescibacteria group bacterium]|jgi:F-type H+-transporting ATPase subunit delta|nr:F0F1 ATP synthase subunit delta [bacterium]HQC49783.1 F0F1 ATP synthase subunit delta [bacterium]
MKITAKQYARALYESTLNKTENEIEKIIARFVENLAHNNDLVIAEKISKEINLIFEVESGEIKTKLISARKLSETVVGQLKDYVIKKTGAQKINFLEEVDKSLIGGFILEYDDKVLDGSIKNNLLIFKKQLSN